MFVHYEFSFHAVVLPLEVRNFGECLSHQDTVNDQHQVHLPRLRDATVRETQTKEEKYSLPIVQ